MAADSCVARVVAPYWRSHGPLRVVRLLTSLVCLAFGVGRYGSVSRCSSRGGAGRGGRSWAREVGAPAGQARQARPPPPPPSQAPHASARGCNQAEDNGRRGAQSVRPLAPPSDHVHQTEEDCHRRRCPRRRFGGGDGGEARWTRERGRDGGAAVLVADQAAAAGGLSASAPRPAAGRAGEREKGWVVVVVLGG